MRKLTAFEISSIDFGKQLTSMNVEGIGEGAKYQFTIELQRISFDCDKNYLGKCNDCNGKQTGYAITLKKENETVEAVYITECFESEAFTALGAYAGSVYMYSTLADTYIRGYTKIQL